MKELHEVVNSHITSMIENGALNDIITERLNQAIKESVNDAMRSYGDFGKALKEKMNASLNHAIENVTFPEYNKFVSEVAIEAYNDVLNEQTKPQITEAIQQFLVPIPKDITAQDLLDKIAEYWREPCNEEGHEYIEIEWSDSHGMHLKIKHPEYDWKTIKISCYDHRTPGVFTIGYLFEDKSGCLSGTLNGATHSDGLRGYLYKLYCTGTTISGFDAVYGESVYIGWD